MQFILLQELAPSACQCAAKIEKKSVGFRAGAASPRRRTYPKINYAIRVPSCIKMSQISRRRRKMKRLKYADTQLNTQNPKRIANVFRS